MQLKSVFLSLVVAALCSTSYAQDKIFKRGGDVIDAKIKNVGTKTVTYTRFDNQSGPEYTIVKNDVSKVKYENGTEENFEDDWHGTSRHRHSSPAAGEERPKPKYGRNVVAIAPLQFTDNGLGFSLSYERVLDKDGIVSFYLPLITTFNLSSGSYYNNTTGTYVNGHQDMMFYAMPGILLYPTGSLGKVRYGIGPSIVYATGEKSSVIYVGSATVEEVKSRTMLGMIINNSLNINPSQHIYMGIELGLGFTYLNRVDGINQDTRGLVQGGFKIGYRF